IVALPFFGIITEVIPVFSRKPVFGYKGLVFATLAIAGLSTGVWAHHMFTTGVVLLPFFSGLSYLIAVPTGIKFFAWIGAMWKGQITFETPMLFAVGFLVVFLLGGLSGILLAAPPIDFFVHDTYYVVAHFHEVLIGTAVLAGFGGFYYWYPKFTGRMMRSGLGKTHFALLIIGFILQTMPQYVLGLYGMPRRIATYTPADHWTTLNMLSSVGGYLIGLSFAIFLANCYASWRHPVMASDNPWDGQTLEWATTSPPPHHNFLWLPPIRSERPTWDYNHGEPARVDVVGPTGVTVE
ncbi:MAG TPA: cbb3-type cytochrome c oxidase subunit I, partial [Acidimicrobiales bacterium]|nr:cbb3-type cytochrome c oxidase subunit I [Acidimicrobiales bacterium]